MSNPEAALANLRAVKLCDPACGSGAYLMGMLHELMVLRLCLAKSEHLDSKSNYDRKLEIIRSNLYGVDLDPIAVNITCIRLWLSMADEFQGGRPEHLPHLKMNVKQGDSLADADVLGADSPEILAKGGFDIMITNPPYLSTKHGFGKENREELEKRFTLAKGHFDAYILFVERGLQMLAPGGTYSYVIPKSALSNSNMRPLRGLMASWSLLAIADPGQVFAAKIEPIIIIGQKRKPTKTTVRLYLNWMPSGKAIMSERKSLSDLVSPAGVWNIGANSVSADKFDSFMELPDFGDFFFITRGVECGKRAECILTEPYPETYPLLRGADIQPYTISFKGYYIRRDDDERKYKSLSLYEGTKLLIRRVSNTLIAAVDFGGHHALNTIYIARQKPGCQVSIEYACAVLNSKVMNDYFQSTYSNDDRLFPYIRKEQLENLPVAIPNRKEEERIRFLVCKLSAGRSRYR